MSVKSLQGRRWCLLRMCFFLCILHKAYVRGQIVAVELGSNLKALRHRTALNKQLTGLPVNYHGGCVLFSCANELEISYQLDALIARSCWHNNTY